MADTNLAETMAFWDKLIKYADVLEKQTTGAEDVTWTAPNGETGKSFLGYVQEFFRVFGHLPRFKTVEALQKNDKDFADGVEGAIELRDGYYALVADDVDDKNGIYIKQSGAWVKSKYDIHKLISQSVKRSSYELAGGVELPNELYKGRTVNPVHYSGIVGRDANYDVIKYDVSGVDEVYISDANESLGWMWLVVNEDISKRLLVTNNYGNGIIKMPSGAKWLIRNYKSISDNVTESDVRVVKKYDKSIKDISDDNAAEINTIEQELGGKADKYVVTKQLEINPVDGALLNNNRGTEALLATGTNPVRQYIYYDVSNIDELVVEGAVEHDGFEWAFANEVSNTAIRHSFANFYGNGVLKIPDGVKYAVRSYYFTGNETYPKREENIDMVITSVKYGPTPEDWRNIIMNAVNTEYMHKYAQKVISESGLNVYKLSDFEGVDSHEKIDNAVAFIKQSKIGGILDLESGVHKRRSAILMPDNFWLYLNDSTLMLEDGVHDNLIRNEGVVINPDPYGFALELNENRNIRVFGNGKDRSFIKGPKVPKTAPHPIKGGTPVPWVGDWYGWRTLEINLVNVKDYAIHGFSLIDSRCWGITQQHGCENFEIHDIYFNNYVKNGDGIDVLLGCKHGRIYNISGLTHDDMIAFSAVNGFVKSLPQGDYIFPMMIGGWVDRGFGIDIEDVYVENVVGSGVYHGVRLLASGGSKVKSVSINKIYDDEHGMGFRVATVLAGTGYGQPGSMGDMIDITVNDVKSYKAWNTLKLNGPLKNVWFNNIRAASPSHSAKLEESKLVSYDNVKFTKIIGTTEVV